MDLIRLILRRARQERLPQVAGSLSFTTLLSLVPLAAVGLALFMRVPAFARFETALQQHLLRNLLPGDIAQTVLMQLHQFAANAVQLTWAGSFFLAVTAIALLLTIENAFNQLWQVRRTRPWLKRIGLYALVLAVAPPALGVVLWASSYLLGLSMGWIGPLPPEAEAVLNYAPAALLGLGLTGLFYLLPNTRVRRRDALVGGVLGSIALELGKRGFTAYLLKIPTYQAVYGAFAVLPVFLLWVYYSWLVILSAALVAASLPRAPAAKPPRPR